MKKNEISKLLSEVLNNVDEAEFEEIYKEVIYKSPAKLQLELLERAVDFIDKYKSDYTTISSDEELDEIICKANRLLKRA